MSHSQEAVNMLNKYVHIYIYVYLLSDPGLLVDNFVYEIIPSTTADA